MQFRELDRHGEHLLSLHETVLASKSVTTTHALLLLIHRDWEKFTCALSAVQNERAARVLEEFFAESPETARMAIEATDGDCVYHVGFEIYEPLDMILTSIPLWLKKLNAAREAQGDATLRMTRLLRFPASESFQNRVRAHAEIMRVWIGSGEREWMLEMFDIHRPASLRAPDPTRPIAPGSLHAPMGDVFRGDSVWHYALHVESSKKVAWLHAALSELAARDSGLVLPYAAPVTNVHDGSFHTKVINVRRGLEIEFIAQL